MARSGVSKATSTRVLPSASLSGVGVQAFGLSAQGLAASSGDQLLLWPS
jgi:hypothetical protein